MVDAGTVLSGALLIGLIPVGLIVLNEGAKLITDNAIFVAERSRRSRFVVGTLVVSTLAALPEVLVSLFALLLGNPYYPNVGPEIAMGNALASNVTTISFVIGLSAMVAPIAANREIVLRDAIFLLTITIVASALLLDGELSALDGIALTALFVPFIVNLLIIPRTVKAEEIEEVLKEQTVEMEYMGHLFGREVKIKRGIRWLAIGAAWAVIGAQFVVQACIQISIHFNVDPWILGITVVAVGTSLPDIAASFNASRHGYSDLALGEGLGANIFTTLMTMGLMGLARPTRYDLSLLVPTILAMNGITLLLLALMSRGWRIGRRSGIILVLSYGAVVVAGFVRWPG